MPSAPREGQLVLQIFPRSEPGRAVTYAGDQEFIRQVLRELGPRLEEGGGSGESTRALDLIQGGEEEGGQDV